MSNITSLKANQVFVFGSNTEGRHGKGAAKQAMEWGAQYGNPRGIQGQTYAIITKDLKKGQRSIPLEYIKEQVQEFLTFAAWNPDKEFLVTRIGCGLGGYLDSEIAPMFKGANHNIILPSEWKTFTQTTGEQTMSNQPSNQVQAQVQTQVTTGEKAMSINAPFAIINHMYSIKEAADNEMSIQAIRKLIAQYNELAAQQSMKEIDVVQYLANHKKPWDVLATREARPVFDQDRYVNPEGEIRTQWFGRLFSYLGNPFSVAMLLNKQGQGNFADMDDLKQNGYANLAFWVAVVGNPLPKEILEGIKAGKVYTYLADKNTSLDWTTETALKVVNKTISAKRSLTLKGEDTKVLETIETIEGKRPKVSLSDLNPELKAFSEYQAIPSIKLEGSYKDITVILPGNLSAEEMAPLDAVLGEGCKTTTMRRIAAAAIKEAAPDFDAWMSYLRATPNSDGMYNIPLSFYGNESSDTQLAVSFKDMKLMVDGTEYNTRNWIAVNGDLTHRGLGLAYFVDYLVRSTSPTVLKGRLAFTLKVTEERNSYGQEHPIATAVRQNKVGNNAVGLMNGEFASYQYSLAINEGPKSAFINISKQAEEWRVPFAMSKSASYLLLGKGAQAAGASIVLSPEGEFYTYHANADKISKLVGGRNFTAIATAITNNLTESLIRIRVEDEVLHFLGDKAPAGVFNSPLMNQGSGTIPANVFAMAMAKFEEDTTVTFSIIAAHGMGKEQSYYVRPAGTILNYGDIVGGRVNKEMPATPGIEDAVGLDQIVTWNHRTQGIILPANGESYGTLNEVTNTWTVKIPVCKISQGEIAEDGAIIKRGTPQKYRGGLMEKGRTLHIDNLFIYEMIGNGEDIKALSDILSLPEVFNPNVDIRQPEHSTKLHRCSGREVGKTPRGFVVSAVADQLPEGHATFDTTTGEWDRWEEIEGLAEKNSKMYVVVQLGVEKNFWNSMKRRFGNDSNFIFFAHEGRLSIAHKCVPGLVGTDVSIVEVPLTEDFAGWQSKFFDDRLYKNVSNGLLGELLEKESAKTEPYNELLFSMVKNEKVEGRQYIVIHPLTTALSIGKESSDISLSTREINGEYYLTNGSLPGYSPSIKFGNQLQKWLKAQSKLVSEQTGKEVNFIGFDFRIGNRSQVVIPQVVSKLSGTVSQNLFRALVAMTYHYASMPRVWNETLGVFENKPATKGWDAELTRHIGTFQGALKNMVISSDATMAKIAKTIPCFATGRVAGSCSDKVEMGKVYLNPVTAEFYGTQSGDRFCCDRVPQPTSVYLEVVVEEWVDPWTFVVSFLDMHAGNEGE